MIAFPLVLIVLLAAAYGYTGYQARVIEAEYPNVGTLTDIGGYKLNAVHIPRPATADLPAIVFIHGASGNLLDQLHAFRSKLEGRAEMLFVDRPGFGYSERGGAQNDFPDGQATAIVRLMDRLGIDKAMIVGHSFGGAVVASLALNHPDKVAGLLFLSPATHPWPGGVDWYYNLAAMPVIGQIFSHLVALPAGMSRIDAGTRAVFHPNPRPENYIAQTGPALVLRPATFRYNAIDVANLHDYVARVAPRYPEIKTPTVIITGDRDDIVLEQIHSVGLARDIAGSELVTVHNMGHKPDYIVTDLDIAALEKISGKPRDLQSLARIAESRIATDGAP